MPGPFAAAGLVRFDPLRPLLLPGMRMRPSKRPVVSPNPGSCLGRRATDEAGGACSGVPLPAWRSPVLRNLMGVVTAAVSAHVAHDGGPKTPPVHGVAGRNEAVKIQVGVRAAFTASRRRRWPGGDRLVEGTVAVFRVCERHTVPTHFSSAGPAIPGNLIRRPCTGPGTGLCSVHVSQ